MVDGAELVDPARLRGTRFGEEFLPRVGVTRLLTGFAVRQGARMASLSFFRPESGPAFGEAERRAWGMLQPHFRRAVWLQERLALADAQAAALDRLLLLDGGGRVLFANAAGDAMLAGEDGLARREGRLVAADGGTAAALDRLIGAVAAVDAGQPSSAGGALAVPRPSGQRPWQLVVSPLPRDLALDLPAGSRARALLVLSDPERRPSPPLDHVRRLLRLTRQEARLVLLLCEGLELKEAAGRLGIGYATARTHLKAAAAKAGVRRQTQLVALTLALLAPRRPDEG